MKKGKGFGKFLCGLAVGAGLGVLFAPASGEKTRKQLKEKLDEIVDYISQIDKDDVKKQLANKVKEIKAELKDLNGEKVAAFAKEQAQNIVDKTDELIKMAKEKAEPVIEKAAIEMRSKAVAILKDAANKLENSQPETNKNKKKNSK